MSFLDQDPIGHRIIRLDSVDSTNNYAAKLFTLGTLPHGSVIMADEQTAGRGQRGAIWSSNPGENLLLTIVLQPVNLSISDQFRLTQFASLAMHELLSKYGLSSAIKWPNDLFVKSLKISGMLIENQVTSNAISNVFLGIGLNVNQTDFDGLSATSMFAETGMKHTLMDVAMSLFSSMNQYWHFVQNTQFVQLDERYQSLLYLRNTLSFFSDDQGDFEGTILGTTEQGLLKVEGRNGEIGTYELKQLRFRQRNDL